MLVPEGGRNFHLNFHTLKYLKNNFNEKSLQSMCSTGKDSIIAKLTLLKIKLKINDDL